MLSLQSMVRRRRAVEDGPDAQIVATLSG